MARRASSSRPCPIPGGRSGREVHFYSLDVDIRLTRGLAAKPISPHHLFSIKENLVRISCKMLLLALTTGLAMSGAGAATHQGTFTAATVDIFDKTVSEGTSFSVEPTGAPIVVDRGPSMSGAYGKARAELGSNGFMATSGSAGFSAWSDGFTVTGGSGSGELDVSVSIHGAIIGREADMAYGLYVSNTPFSIDSELGLNDSNLSTVLVNTNRLLSYSINNADKTPNTTLTGKLDFTFGQQFYLISYLYGDVCTPLEGLDHVDCTGGSEDFYHSAVFGLTAPASAVINTLSGHEYAAAVPESGSLALFIFGLLTISISRRRSQQVDA
jgi:hypothetical protein